MTATYFGMNPPFIGGAENILSRQEDDRLIKNDILQKLMTVPGERVMRPDFGVNLRNFVFEPMTENDLSSLREEIGTKVAEDPRIIVRSVDLERDDDNNQLNIKIVVSIRKDPKRRLTIEQSIDVAASS
jgi:uncharacterized protein